MENLNLEESIKRGESQTLEFKETLSLQKKGMESLCAMVNSGSAQGEVVFGIRRDGAVCGVEPGNLDSAQRSLGQAIRDKFDPPLIVHIETKELHGKTVLALRAERSRHVPYHEFDGRVWIREGTTNRVLSLAEKQSLTSKRNRDKHPGPWGCDKCGSMVGALFSYEVTAEGMKKTYKCGCGGEYWPVS